MYSRSLLILRRSASTGSWQMKQKPNEPSKFGKYLPEKIRKAMEQKGKPKVAVINLHGMIASNSGRSLGGRQPLNIQSTEKLIDKAFSQKKLEAVFLSINSPGGSAVQSELIADYIGQKSRQKGVPVISFVEDVAASGGYWLATSAPVIYVSKSSIVGSIGVISQSFGLHQTIEKLGIERRTQTAGECKAFGDPFKPQEERDKVIVRNILGILHENFKGQVKNSRGDKLREESKLFSGEVWVGQQAVDLGLVDGVNSIHKFIEAEMGGLDKVNLLRIGAQKKFPFLPGADAGGVIENTAFAREVAQAFLQEVEYSSHSFDKFRV